MAFFRLRLHLQSLSYSRCTIVWGPRAARWNTASAGMRLDVLDGQRHTAVFVTLTNCQCSFLLMRVPSASLQYGYWLCLYKSCMVTFSKLY